MIYRIKFRAYPYRDSWLKTWDGKVIEASPAFNWAIGKNIVIVTVWLKEHGMSWEVKLK